MPYESRASPARPVVGRDSDQAGCQGGCGLLHGRGDFEEIRCLGGIRKSLTIGSPRSGLVTIDGSRQQSSGEWIVHQTDTGREWAYVLRAGKRLQGKSTVGPNLVPSAIFYGTNILQSRFSPLKSPATARFDAPTC